MKKYIAIICMSLVGCAALALLYYRSQSDFSHDHQQTMRQFANIQQSDTSLDKEILSLRYSFELSDVGLDQPIKNIQDFCNLTVMQYFFNSTSKAYDQGFEVFCKHQFARIESVQIFKEKQVRYRDALKILKGEIGHLATDSNLRRNETAANDLVQTALGYVFTPTPEMHDQLQKKLQKARNAGVRQDLILSADEILTVRTELDQLLAAIIKAKPKVLIGDLRDLYFDDYQKDQVLAARYSNILFIACLLLFAFVMMNSLKLLRATQELRTVNETLEDRVQQRTQELTESKNKLLEQQQALINVSKMSALGEMAAGIAHEINTPLATIQMRTTQLLESISDDQELDKDFFRTALGKIDLTSTRIAKIIKGLLSFSRDGLQDDRELTSVQKIVEETFDLCKERFKHENVHLDFVNECGDVRILCHPMAISQVLLNFLNNSFDAIQKLPSKWIRVQLQTIPDAVIISITDSGLGIPFEIQEKIMHPFFTTKEVGKGTGLGLSISTGIVRSHGGTIGIDNTSPNTKFVLTFPSI